MVNMRSKFVFLDLLKDEIKPILCIIIIGSNILPTLATCQFICMFQLLRARLLVLTSDSDTALSLSSHHQTRCVASSKLYIIRELYSVQHLTVRNILT